MIPAKLLSDSASANSQKPTQAEFTWDSVNIVTLWYLIERISFPVPLTSDADLL